MKKLLFALFIIAGCSTGSECDHVFTGKYETAVRYPEPFAVFVYEGHQYNIFMRTDKIADLDRGKTYSICYEIRDGRMYAD